MSERKPDVDQDGVYHGAPVSKKPPHTNNDRFCEHCGKKLCGYNTAPSSDPRHNKRKKRYFCFAHKRIGIEIEDQELLKKNNEQRKAHLLKLRKRTSCAED